MNQKQYQKRYITLHKIKVVVHSNLLNSIVASITYIITKILIYCDIFVIYVVIIQKI